ncbi:hypothetical protein GGI25_004226 [Coemansia spiralis]|uniref:Septicolysin n=2 Tax=Coemansia TaxID=4863 RepID=A0A9W8G6Z5_9FUNG|nr:hypothetical protein EDC05_005673 [Coemansia umbellata]KAJ2619432.1 hypothetical protein GGI26_005832 [Coemansia sp. RSA 1358]KAJ2674763.1 hypothetical protein GGI25_004226 [Coemansia spiralis]
MKLAEALILRADLDKSIEQLKNRVVSNSLVQEGTSPAEDPEELLKELHMKLNEYKELVIKINTTNLNAKTSEGLNLTSAIAERDRLQRLHGILSSVSNHANSTTDRYSKKEILNISTVDVASLRKQVDKVAERRRKIDVEIQAANWTSDLI